MSDPLPSTLPESLRRFGRYTLLYRIGSGGMAEVYLARFTGTDGFQKLVVIKLIHREFTASPEFISMFIDEARLASRISHANVAQVLELGRVGETHFIAMEYVDGESLEALAERVPDLSLPYVARILANAAAGLHAAHELRDNAGKLLEVVHRDVSPANILISYDGEVKVIDFGVARARDTADISAAGEVKGKFAYMAPEQAHDRPIDRRADIFSLGVVLHELTTHRPLFRGESEPATLANLISSDIPRPSDLVPGYPPALETVVLRALEREPERRFQTAQELQEALEHFIVESGNLVLPAQVGQMMRGAFDESIAQKRALLGRAQKEAGPAALTGTAEEVSVVGAPPEARRPVMLLVAIGALAAVALVLVLVLSLRGGPPDKKPVALDMRVAPDTTRGVMPDAAPASITISIRVAPESARLTFDGKPVDNPFATTRPAGRGEVEVEASARGYATKTFKVSLGRDSEHVIMLEREHHTGPHPKNNKKNGKKHGGVLVNPYDD